MATRSIGQTATALTLGASIPVSRYACLHSFVPLASPKNASLLYALANLLLLFGLLALLYRRRIFLRV